MQGANMSVTFRQYNNTILYGDDYNSVRDFLIELDSHNYPFGRWDWMMMNQSFWGRDQRSLAKIGIWEDSNRIGNKVIAITTFDSGLGSAFLLTLKGYEKLKEEILIHAKANLAKDGKFRVMILDGDLEMQDIAAKNGFYPTKDKEEEAVFPVEPGKIKYDLPKGFSITSFKDNFDLYKYGQAMWKGFNHEVKEEGPFSFIWEKDSEIYKQSWDRPNIDLSLKIFVVAPNGDFVSHCGMWFDKKCKNALVEPVATEPAYRKMGLGKAAVLEGVKRCGELGAINAFVGSSQQFYYSIGFRPYATSTWWKEK
jgi:GNAT superfamily N-acetyltransferase